MLAPQTIFVVNSSTLKVIESSTLPIVCHNVNSTAPRLIKIPIPSTVFTIGYIVVAVVVAVVVIVVVVVYYI